MGSLTLSFIVNNWDHVFVLYAKRAIAFIGNWVWQKPTDLTTLAGIQQFAKYMLPTVLFFVGIAGAFAAKIFRKASIVWLMVLATLLFCVVFFIDAMYRYRLPAVPFLIIGIAFGAERIVHTAIVLAKLGTRIGKKAWEMQRGRSEQPPSYASGGLPDSNQGTATKA
jgi:hypothetical protein